MAQQPPPPPPKGTGFTKAIMEHRLLVLLGIVGRIIGVKESLMAADEKGFVCVHQ